ncbi:MAG: hypothetical protein SVV80_09935, partial [Planctomycetota bacterium]|nr:hypothetical protein [Planctomycetota bacterium]
AKSVEERTLQPSHGYGWAGSGVITCSSFLMPPQTYTKYLTQPAPLANAQYRLCRSALFNNATCSKKG